MSKLLKKIATKHRPHIAARMTEENGYKESEHHFASDLAAAGIISAAEAADLDGCVDDLASDGHDGALAMKAAKTGELDKDKLNLDDFIASLDGGSDIEDDGAGEEENLATA